MAVEIKAFFHEPTFTVSYVVSDPVTKACAVIDPVLDFDAPSGRVSHAYADRIIAFVRKQALDLKFILETHAHADHLSAGSYIKSALGGKIAIGEHIVDVQKIFGAIFNLRSEFRPDGSQFDVLLRDGDTFSLGSLKVRVLHTPGHTPACVSYIIEDAAFVGDTLFQPDYGTARTDFPGGDAATLYRSIQKILALPDNTRIFTCHDYKATGRAQYAWESSVWSQRKTNIHVHLGVSENQFVALRTARDKTLAMPHLLLPAIQVNIRAGAMPPAEDNGIAYLKLPINAI